MDDYYSDEDYYREGVEREDDIMFSEKPGYADYKNTGGFANPDIGTTATMGRYADAADNFRRLAYVHIQKYDDGISKSNRDEAADFVKAIPRERLLLLNVLILAPALIYLSLSKRKIEKDSILSFVKKHLEKDINIFDFVRYVRYMNKILLIKKRE